MKTHFLIHFLCTEYLWTAPEILKLGFEESLLRGTKEGDVYSFGLIMKELIKREIPFVDQPDDQRLSQLIADIASGILKAENHVACNGNGIPEHVFEIMRRCVSYVPSRRMTFTEIQNVVQKIDKSMGSRSGKSNIGMVCGYGLIPGLIIIIIYILY